MPGRNDASGPCISPEEREHLDARLLATNAKISRYLTVITLLMVPVLYQIDVQRWQMGLLQGSALHLALAALHAGLALSVVPGLVLWLKDRVSRSLHRAASRAHLVAMTSTLAGMGILGIPERGSLVVLAIALVCTNLVFEIPSRQRLWFNLGLSLATALTLKAFPGADMLKSFILAGESLALVLICAVAGESRFRDFTALVLAENKMARMAHFDALTGIANRRSLEDHLRRHLSMVGRGQALTVALVDVDHFKSVNDRFGHDTGDAVLRIVAQTLLAGVRQFDIVGRWGGEEFLVICPDTGGETGGVVAERLAAALRGREIDGVGRATASFGVAQAEQGETAERLLVRADQALYAAKSAGRDRVCLAT